MRVIRTIGVSLVTMLVAASCGGDGVATGDEDPCSLVDATTVAESFGGESASGMAGNARNCSFTITNGIVPNVDVFHYGASSAWESTREGFEDNRGGTTDVSGVGDEAFHPNDRGPTEIVVRSGDIIFSVSVFLLKGPEVEAAILDLAGEIADR